MRGSLVVLALVLLTAGQSPAQQPDRSACDTVAARFYPDSASISVFLDVVDQWQEGSELRRDAQRAILKYWLKYRTWTDAPDGYPPWLATPAPYEIIEDPAPPYVGQQPFADRLTEAVEQHFNVAVNPDCSLDHEFLRQSAYVAGDYDFYFDRMAEAEVQWAEKYTPAAYRLEMLRTVALTQQGKTDEAEASLERIQDLYVDEVSNADASWADHVETLILNRKIWRGRSDSVKAEIRDGLAGLVFLLERGRLAELGPYLPVDSFGLRLRVPLAHPSFDPVPNSNEWGFDAFDYLYASPESIVPAFRSGEVSVKLVIEAVSSLLDHLHLMRFGSEVEGSLIYAPFAMLVGRGQHRWVLKQISIH